MTTLRQALTAAIGCHQDGKLGDAAGIYRLVLTVQPENPVALYNLALLTEGEEQVALFRRALAADPGNLHAAFHLGQALEASARLDEATLMYRRTLDALPNEPELHFALAHALQRLGEREPAAAHYQRAIALRADYVPALSNLATLFTAADQVDEAAALYRQALAIDPTLVVANMNMVGILEGEGRLAEAQALRERVPRPQPPIVEQAVGGELGTEHRRVLVLASSKGNVPVEDLLPLATTTRITWHVEYASHAQEDALPAYDVAFNGIGNADVLPASHAVVEGLHRRCPVLNPPDAVAQTRRDRLPELLACIPGVVVPPVIRLSRDEMAAPHLAARLAKAGLPCPVLVRPIVGHGGQGLVLVQTAEELAALPGDADAYYVIAFADYQSIDGFWRKYRTIFVDRTPFAYHLAISPHWLVHYATSDMLAAPWKREEERCFLDDPAAALGARAMTALQEIGRRMDLDFAGIDFSLLPDGRLLVFEANATMLVHLRDPAAEFGYKHRAVPKIFAAFNAMLDRHSAASRHQRARAGRITQ